MDLDRWMDRYTSTYEGMEWNTTTITIYSPYVEEGALHPGHTGGQREDYALGDLRTDRCRKHDDEGGIHEEMR